MNARQLSDAMLFLDDSLLEETHTALQKRPTRLRRLALAAACLCCAALVVARAVVWAYAGVPTLPNAASLPPGEGSPAPASHTDDSAPSDEGRAPAPPSGADGEAPGAREDTSPEYLASILREEIPPHGAVDPTLPILSLSGEDFADGMGFEGYLACDISELENSGPWRAGDAVSALPVYRIPQAQDASGDTHGADTTAMRALLFDIAARLGYDSALLSVRDDAPDEAAQEAIREKFAVAGADVPAGYFAPSRLIGEADGLKIEVDSALTVTVTFSPALPLPDGCSLADGASRAEMEAAGAFVLAQYRALLGFSTPAAVLDAGDRNIYGEQAYELRLYDASPDAARNLENYWLDCWNFYGGDTGGLWLARWRHADRSEKLGDYPVITPAEAWQLLGSGCYLTTIPAAPPEDAMPARVDLLYRSDTGAQASLPYYRFLIELPDMAQGGMKCYGAYYVPAVQSEYLDALPVWDGSFS